MPDGTTLTATDMIAEAARQPTLDELMARDPATLTREDRRLMIEALRAERAQWIAEQERKAEKKEAEE